jgi:hypothetical protein
MVGVKSYYSYVNWLSHSKLKREQKTPTSRVIGGRTNPRLFMSHKSNALI